MTIERFMFKIFVEIATTIIARLILVVNGLKRVLPFVKVVIVADRDNWIAINYDLLALRLLFSRHIVVHKPFVPKKITNMLSVDADFRSAEHKGINLYRISEYNLCVDLELFPLRISFENETHRAAIEKWFAVSVECIDFYERIVLQKRPDRMLISQGHTYDAAIVRALSCRHGFKIVAVENTFDSRKIVWEDISGVTVNKNLAKNYYWKYHDFVSGIYADHYVKEYLENIKQIKAQEHQTPSEAVSKSVKKTVLFIGQVYTDSSVLFGINDFCCPVSIIDQLVDYCLANNYHLIVKLHPKETTGNDILKRSYNNLTYRKILAQEGLLEKMSCAGFILDKDRYDTYALIDSSDVCVTINSQAGLEALIKGKDVIACGQAYYTGLGFTFEALNSECLTCLLDLVLKRCVTILRRDEINKFFYIISEKYFVSRADESVKALLLRNV